MFEHLNIRTREIVSKILSKEPVLLGGKEIETYNDLESRSLYIISSNLPNFIDKSGEELAIKVAEQINNLKEIPDLKNYVLQKPDIDDIKHWKLGKIRAFSFRGLAPAGYTWTHNFYGKSHLLYGPNGCGKSSLLGAISWCLSGRIFRDDCPPSPPENVSTYTSDGNNIVSKTRPDALTLTNENGSSTDSEEEFWVEIQFISDTSNGANNEIWIRRHSIDGLKKSIDGSNWEEINNIGEAGLSELDVELQLLMPARVPHIKFGKNQDLIHVLSQIVGYDYLEQIAILANKVKTSLNKIANRIENKELKIMNEKENNFIDTIENTATENVRNLPFYNPIMSKKRSFDDIKEFKNNIEINIKKLNDQFARDLGIKIPNDGTLEYDEFKKQIKYLPGYVQSAITEISKPISDIFSSSIGFSVPDESELKNRKEKLNRFRIGAKIKIQERLDWALKEAKNEKLQLMLNATENFPEDSKYCPVCTQSLERVPHIQKQLEDLRPFVNKPHIKKDIDDLELKLIDDLNKIVSYNEQAQSEKSLTNRISKDWNNNKSILFPELLNKLKEKFDIEIQNLIQKISEEPIGKTYIFADDFKNHFPKAFKKFDSAYESAQKFIDLANSINKNYDILNKTLTDLLKPLNDGGGRNSLSMILQRGNSTKDELDTIKIIKNCVDELEKSSINIKELRIKINNYHEIAGALDTIKSFEYLVRQEVIEVLKSIESQTINYYSSLYDNEILPLKKLITGHPANPNIKDEINVYYNAGHELVPIGPFSNAGRFRALNLSFVFALLEKSTESLSLLILDDPVLSLDDQHKAHFLDKIIEPILERKQVILATHYNNFYKYAEPIFENAERLELPPKRKYCDKVSFEPGDLLQKVEDSLNLSNCSWRDKGINLRFWVERTLCTISGYCPEPFIINNFSDTVKEYGKITDPLIATDARDRIIKVFQKRIIHRIAHDEEIDEPEVKDALLVLKECKKDVDKEIERFKSLYRHRLLDRAIESRPVIKVLPFHEFIPETEFKIVAQAAAASDGIGLMMKEYEICELSGHNVGIVKFDTLAPIALVGQYVILDNKDIIPNNSDLVVAETEDGGKYLRRFWKDNDNNINLEAINLTNPYPPISPNEGICKLRRMVGVMFENVNCTTDKIGKEWAKTGNQPENIFKDLIGIKVDGTSMEPIARDGQIVLVRKENIKNVKKGDLACVDIKDVGAVIKRCYPSDNKWILLPVNPNEPEEPISVINEDIQNVYSLVGVLFEYNSKEIIEE